MKVLPALALAALVAGCASNSVQSFAMIQEKAETECENLYTALATSINAYEALPSTTLAEKTKAEAVKVKAWNDLLAARAAYAAGQVVDASLLVADQAQVSTVTAPSAPVS